jgi:hypothetical protein
MPTPDLIQGIDLPVYGDAPAVPDHLADIWYAAIQRGLPRFANTAARDTAYPAPTDGQFCWVTSLLAAQVYQSGWKTFWASPGGVVKREVLTGSGVITPAAGMAIGGSTRAHIDHGFDGTRTVSLYVDGVVVPTAAGLATGNWGTVVSSLRPATDVPVQMVHAVHLGLGWLLSTGVLAIRWGTFSTTSTGAVRATATYPLPAP